MGRRKKTDPRPETYAVVIRLDPQSVAVLRRFATDHNYYNKSGDPNLSMAARTLLGLGLKSTGGDAVDMYMNNARAEWLDRVNTAWRDAMTIVLRAGTGE
jgi:hypothetical protein